MTIYDGCDGILDSVSVVKISSLSSRPSRKGETWKENHRCRYQKIYYWHCSSIILPGNEEYLPEIEKALMEKLDSMVKRQLIYNIQNSTNRGRTGKGKTRVFG